MIFARNSISLICSFEKSDLINNGNRIFSPKSPPCDWADCRWHSLRTFCQCPRSHSKVAHSRFCSCCFPKGHINPSQPCRIPDRISAQSGRREESRWSHCRGPSSEDFPRPISRRWNWKRACRSDGIGIMSKSEIGTKKWVSKEILFLRSINQLVECCSLDG